jgi:hypothetical protein
LPVFSLSAFWFCALCWSTWFAFAELLEADEVLFWVAAPPFETFVAP